MEIKKVDPNIVKYIIGGVIALFAVNKILGGIGGVWKDVLVKFGLSTDPQTKAAADYIASQGTKLNNAGTGSYWSPEYWKQVSPNTKLVYDTAISAYIYSIAEDIIEGIGVGPLIWDNPAQIIAAFKKINSKLGVSVVASAFAYKYKLDLLSFLVSNLDTPDQVKDMASILQYTEALPAILSGQ